MPSRSSYTSLSNSLVFPNFLMQPVNVASYSDEQSICLCFLQYDLAYCREPPVVLGESPKKYSLCTSAALPRSSYASSPNSLVLPNFLGNLPSGILFRWVICLSLFSEVRSWILKIFNPLRVSSL